MRPSEVRASLRSWLESLVPVDEWGIGMPAEIYSYDRPPSKGREKPVTEFVGVLPQGGDESILSEKIELQVVYRYPATQNYETLTQNGRNQLEDAIATGICHLCVHPECLGEDVREVKVMAIVSCPQLKSRDWLLSARVVFTVRFVAETTL